MCLDVAVRRGSECNTESVTTNFYAQRSRSQVVLVGGENNHPEG